MNKLSNRKHEGKYMSKILTSQKIAYLFVQ